MRCEGDVEDDETQVLDATESVRRGDRDVRTRGAVSAETGESRVSESRRVDNQRKSPRASPTCLTAVSRVHRGQRHHSRLQDPLREVPGQWVCAESYRLAAQVPRAGSARQWASPRPLLPSVACTARELAPSRGAVWQCLRGSDNTGRIWTFAGSSLG